MAYTHAQTDTRAKLGSMVVVGGLHAAVGIGLVTALSVTVSLDPPAPNPTGILIEDDPIVLPPPPPTDAAETPADPLSPPSDITAPIPDNPLTKEQGNIVKLPPLGPIGPVAPTAGLEVDPITLPPLSGPTFSPASAVPRNGPQGWITTDDYPRSDLNRGNEGTARYALSISANGRVEDCAITSSTGHKGLDRATCRYIERRARFEPALNGEQRPVGGTYSGTVTWQIPE